MKPALFAPSLVLFAACSSTSVSEPRMALGAEPVAMPTVNPDPAPATSPSVAGSDLERTEPTPARLSLASFEDPNPNKQVWAINFLLGGRTFADDDFWDPIEEQPSFMIDVTSYKPSWPVGFEFGLGGSYEEEGSGIFKVESRTSELYGGVRKTWDVLGKKLHPYVGGGLSAIVSDAENPIVDDDDNSIGFYVHGGVYYSFGNVFNLGVDYRILTGSDIDLFGVGGDADYQQLSLILGFSL